MGGSVERMKNYAEQYHKETSVGLSENLSKTDRFVMYKTGPVLWVNHGMGIPSLSICLQECIKLMYYAETTDVTFMRLGTSGGLGVEPGTVVISTGAINEFLKPEYIQAVLGKKVKHDAILDKALSDELYECRRFVNTPVEKGITMGTDCFFEGQARLDGPFCDYSSEDATAFLRKLYELGVRNVEMECNCFAAITYRAGIRSAIICVTVVDRLHDDTLKIQKPIFLSPKAFREYEMRTFKLASAYFKDRLANIANNK